MPSAVIGPGDTGIGNRLVDELQLVEGNGDQTLRHRETADADHDQLYVPALVHQESLIEPMLVVVVIDIGADDPDVRQSPRVDADATCWRGRKSSSGFVRTQHPQAERNLITWSRLFC